MIRELAGATDLQPEELLCEGFQSDQIRRDDHCR